MRLDVFLQGHLKLTRNKAQELIKSGAVILGGKRVLRPGFNYAGEPLEVSAPKIYASRAALKLKNFLELASISVAGDVCIDIGSSTGGWTQVLLEAGAKSVDCVDVGSSQLSAELRAHPQIRVFENTDIRAFNAGRAYDLAVCDVSFVSVMKLASAINALDFKRLVLLFKPQFEVGKEARRDKRGVVLDQKAIERARGGFESAFGGLGWELLRVEKSSIKGKNGNEEFVYYIQKY